MHLNAVVWRDGDFYVGGCVEVEIACQGGIVEEASEHLKEALTLYFEHAPVPRSTGLVFLTSLDVKLPVPA